MDFEKQNGQAAVEFAMAVMVFLFFIMAMPLFGELFHIRLGMVSSANYALWRQVRDDVPLSDSVLSMQLDSRFFTHRPGDASPLATIAGVPRIINGQPLMGPGAIRVVTQRSSLVGGSAIRMSRDALGLAPAQVTAVTVTARLNHLPGYSWMPDNMVMTQRMAGMGHTWSASAPDEIIDRVGHASRLYPYPKAQKTVISTVNRALDLIFGEVKIQTDLVKPDIVPADRLESYAH